MRQDDRLLRLHTPLGRDRLVATSLAGEEGMSMPFRFRVEAFSLDMPVDLAALVGRPAVVTLRSGGEDDRHFHGYVSDAGYLGHDFASGRFRYEMALVPWLWFLSQRVDSRIFQGESAVQIAERIFRELGFADYELKLEVTPPPRPYCVQYRESDLNFLCRLWEEDGIHFFFRHEAGRHVLVLADGPAAHLPFAGDGLLSVKRGDMADPAPGITSLTERRQVISGRFAVGDHNFETPRRSLTASTSQPAPLAHAADLELFVHPAGHADTAGGDRRARLWQERLEVERCQLDGGSNDPRLACGTRLRVGGHEVPALDADYLLLSVHHSAGSDLDGQGAYYANSFRALPATIHFRPPEQHPRPVVEGPQTAIIVGPAGQEIHTDAYGRVRVSFHWDRRSRADESASCWIRVAQGLAGGRWGGLFIPRVGMEVVVSFLDGNPDRPLITGCVYNADNMPPYPLPAHKTRSVLKSRSTPKSSGFNEIRMEDKAGAEHIFVHAQRDLDLRVRARRRILIGSGDHLRVGGDRRVSVGGDDGLEARRDIRRKAGADWSLDAGSDIDMRAGTKLAAKAGQQLVLESGLSLTLKAGGSFITLSQAGVSISGPLVLINSGGSPSGLSAEPEPPAPPDTPPTADGGGDTTAQARQLLRPAGSRARIAQVEALRMAARDGIPFCQLCGGE